MKFVPFKPPIKQRSRPADKQLPRVLYVEDEDLNYEITENELEDRFLLTRARDAKEAFDLLRQNTYHLILMDIQLSGSHFDGITATRILKGRLGDAEFPVWAQGVRAVATPIVFVTAYASRYGHDELIAAGGEDLVTKPVNFPRLSLIIARVWANRLPVS